jgi:hydroxylamine reductase (hybrid-cluster protein)
MILGWVTCLLGIDVSEVPIYQTTRRYNKKAVIILFTIMTILYSILNIKFCSRKFYTVTKQKCSRQNKHIPKKEHKDTN